MQWGLHGPWRSRVRFPPRAQARSSSAVEHQECLRNSCHRLCCVPRRTPGFIRLSAGVHLPPQQRTSSGCGSTWQSARLGPERLRVQISPPRPTRGSSSGDGTCPTNRPRRVRSSRPVPARTYAHGIIARVGEWHSHPAENRGRKTMQVRVLPRAPRVRFPRSTFIVRRRFERSRQAFRSRSDRRVAIGFACLVAGCSTVIELTCRTRVQIPSANERSL
jgi:hypothetical protein